MAGAAVSRSRAILPSSQNPPESFRGRAPSAVRCKFLFFVAHEELCVLVPTLQDLATWLHQRLADLWRGRSKAFFFQSPSSPHICDSSTRMLKPWQVQLCCVQQWVFPCPCPNSPRSHPGRAPSAGQLPIFLWKITFY